MSDCDPQLLSAYIDGELLPVDRDRMEAHVRNCPACAQELELLRGLSSALRDVQFDELNASELRQIHSAIDESADQPILRLGLTLSAIAASILVVGSAWLMELPGASRTPAVATTPSPSWEQMAMTLSPGPLMEAGGGGNEIQLARADFADWMLDGLRK